MLEGRKRGWMKHVLHAGVRKGKANSDCYAEGQSQSDQDVVAVGLSGVATEEVALGLGRATLLIDLEGVDRPVSILERRRVAGDVFDT